MSLLNPNIADKSLDKVRLYNDWLEETETFLEKYGTVKFVQDIYKWIDKHSTTWCYDDKRPHIIDDIPLTELEKQVGLLHKIYELRPIVQAAYIAPDPNEPFDNMGMMNLKLYTQIQRAQYRTFRINGKDELKIRTYNVIDLHHVHEWPMWLLLQDGHLSPLFDGCTVYLRDYTWPYETPPDPQVFKNLNWPREMEREYTDPAQKKRQN